MPAMGIYYLPPICIAMAKDRDEREVKKELESLYRSPHSQCQHKKVFYWLNPSPAQKRKDKLGQIDND